MAVRVYLVVFGCGEVAAWFGRVQNVELESRCKADGAEEAGVVNGWKESSFEGLQCSVDGNGETCVLNRRELLCGMGV